jgi:mannonate dehydratase
MFGFANVDQEGHLINGHRGTENASTCDVSEAVMNRREFLAGSVLATGVPDARAVSPLATPEKPDHGKRPKMKAGHQHHSSDADLRLLAALGVRNICSALPSRALDENWSIAGLSRLRERVEHFGIHLDMVPLPLSNTPVSRAENPNILLGKSPERDREIDRICQMIRNVAKVGIPAVKYNFTLLGVLRTGSTRGRGGARYSTFVARQAKDGPPVAGGPVSTEEFWERITYFLQRVVPVAEECNVRLCCHPHDPAVAPSGFRGIQRVLGSVAGLKRLIDIMPSPYHGLNFCQGSVAEMLQNPGKEIYDVIRYFGSRGKIFNVHFRNIKGGYLDFQETFPDDGDVDMLRALRVYKEVGYDGMIMPDHVPQIEGDPNQSQAFAFAFGYIQALLQAV